jgi:hypothetical protein
MISSIHLDSHLSLALTAPPAMEVISLVKINVELHVVLSENDWVNIYFLVPVLLDRISVIYGFG